MHDKCSPAILPHVLLRLRTDDRLQVRAEAVPGLKFGVQERTAVNIFQSKVVARDQVEKPFTQLISWETFGWVDGADERTMARGASGAVRELLLLDGTAAHYSADESAVLLRHDMTS